MQPASIIEPAAQAFNRCKRQALVYGIKYQRIGADPNYVQDLEALLETAAIESGKPAIEFHSQSRLACGLVGVSLPSVSAVDVVSFGDYGGVCRTKFRIAQTAKRSTGHDGRRPRGDAVTVTRPLLRE